MCPDAVLSLSCARWLSSIIPRKDVVNNSVKVTNLLSSTKYDMKLRFIFSSSQSLESNATNITTRKICMKFFSFYLRYEKYVPFAPPPFSMSTALCRQEHLFCASCQVACLHTIDMGTEAIKYPRLHFFSGTIRKRGAGRTCSQSTRRGLERRSSVLRLQASLFPSSPIVHFCYISTWISSFPCHQGFIV